MNKKKALCLASMASNLDNFNRNNVKLLQELDYDVTLAANFCTSEDSSSQKKIDSFRKEMKHDGVHTVQIDFSRKIAKVNKQIKSIKQVKSLLSNNYDLIHCHTPICAAITRLCAMKYQKKGKVKVIYTAHGFHFFKGAPIKNWILYYPVEKWLSRYTDVLITINKEDYRRAKKYFRAKKTEYVPGVGVDTKKFTPSKYGREKIRKELCLKDNQIMLLSVGELNENKNHISVVKAIKGTDYVYVIVGKGEKKAELECTAKECNVDLRLMGYRRDVADFYNAADVYVLPSLREGLNVSLMESMASGLAVACSDIRGNVDLIERSLFAPNVITEIGKAVEDAVIHKDDLSAKNIIDIKRFDINIVNKLMYRIIIDLG